MAVLGRSRERGSSAAGCCTAVEGRQALLPGAMVDFVVVDGAVVGVAGGGLRTRPGQQDHSCLRELDGLLVERDRLCVVAEVVIGVAEAVQVDGLAPDVAGPGARGDRRSLPAAGERLLEATELGVAPAKGVRSAPRHTDVQSPAQPQRLPGIARRMTESALPDARQHQGVVLACLQGDGAELPGDAQGCRQLFRRLLVRAERVIGAADEVMGVGLRGQVSEAARGGERYLLGCFQVMPESLPVEEWRDGPGQLPGVSTRPVTGGLADRGDSTRRSARNHSSACGRLVISSGRTPGCGPLSGSSSGTH